MQTFILLLLKSIACSGILFAYYLLFLKSKKLLSYNRYYLLSSVLISLIIPFLNFEWYSITPSASNPVTLLEVVNNSGAEEITPTAKQTFISKELVAGGLYLSISLCLLAMLVRRLIWIYNLKRKGAVQKTASYDLIYTESTQAPFSFLNNLFWKKSIDVETETGQQILRHELCHIQQNHSLDKLFMHLVLIVAWANPIYWFIRKELALQHEFIADEAAIQDRDTETFARMILQSQYGNIRPDIIHPFFHSSIKRRFIMLTRSKNTKFSYLRKVMLLPLAATVLFLLSFKVSRKEVQVNRGKEIISVVFDAGHGGKDDGGTGVNGVKEKDLTLKVCNKLMQLAGEYNIKASLTRDDDSYPSLQERVELSDKYAADVFVSIHINKMVEGETHDDYEVALSGKNKYPQESRALGSAITNRLKTLHINPAFVQRGVHVVRENNRPALLIECGNIDNAEQMAMLTDNARLEKFCRQILSGIVDYQNSKK